jgi:hypothetical protein
VSLYSYLRVDRLITDVIISPSFGDVKRMIEDEEIFTSDEVQELKAQLKAKAVEICDEVSPNISLPFTF